MNKPKTIALFAKNFNSSILATLRATYQFLSNHFNNQQAPIYIEQHTAKALGLNLNKTSNNPIQLQLFDIQSIPDSIDLLIVVGGDGSMLYASRFAVDQGIPIVGINLGRLGFLTDILPDQINSNLTEILHGNYSIEQRFLLNTVAGAYQCNALNEITITANRIAQLIEFDIYIDNQLMYQQHSDGLIIATPTGSTAYALSGGGPILQPNLDAIVLVPMFPHTLSMRPIVLSSNSAIMIKPKSKQTISLCGDGQNTTVLSDNTTIYIAKHDSPLELIHPPGYNYFQSLRSKLHWAKKPSAHHDHDHTSN